MKSVVIVGMGRTAVGRMGGALKDVPAIDLATFIIEQVCQRSGVDKQLIDGVIFGNVENRSDESCLARWAPSRPVCGRTATDTTCSGSAAPACRPSTMA